MERGFKKVAVLALALGMSLNSNSILAEEISLINIADDIPLRVIVEELKYIEDQGKLSDIVIQERRAGCLTESKEKEARTVTLSLEGTRFNFTSLPKVILSDGYVGLNTPKVEYLDSSQQLIGITMPYCGDLNEKGKMTLSGLGIEGLDISTGQVAIQIGSLLDDTELAEIVVAEIAEYGINLDTKQEYSIKPGGSQNVTFMVKEILAGSLVSGNSIECSLDNGYFKTDRSGNIQGGQVYLNGVEVTSKVNLDGYDSSGYVTNFEITVPDLNTNQVNTLTFSNFKVCTNTEDSGEINLFVQGRGVPEEASTLLAEITTGTEVDVFGIEGVIGEHNQVGGRFELKEESKGNLEAGYIKLKIEGSPYVVFNKEPIVEVIEGNLTVKCLGWDREEENTLILKVTKKSTRPSTLVIRDFGFSVNTMAPQGGYDLYLSGSAISPLDETYKLQYTDFMTLSMPNQNSSYDDSNNSYNTTINNTNIYNNNIYNYNIYNNNGDDSYYDYSNHDNSYLNYNTASKITEFVVGSKNYTINGIMNQMDATPFIQDGRIMVPVRYVAEAVGVSSDDIIFMNDTITIKGERMIVLYLNSNKLVVDGVAYTMQAKPVICDQRTYIPIAEISKALDLQIDWNQETQTATFVK